MSQNTPQPHIMIGTPAYGGMVHVDFVHNLLTYRQADIAFTLITLGNESLITRARNSLISMFWHNQAFSHLLFLDADVALMANDLQYMLSCNKDVIGAPVALKGRTASGARIFNVGNAVGEAGELVLTSRIGTAALMLSRHAVGALIQDAKDDGRVYNRGDNNRGDTGSSVHYDVFQVGVQEGEYLSEDYWVCASLRRLGFAIHLAPAICTRHHGTMTA
jgi:hypothetical protein